MDPLNRPGVRYVLGQFEIIDQDITQTVRTVCHFCCKGKQKLHQLRCGHLLCRKCWFWAIEKQTEEAPTEEHKATPKAKCKVCEAELILGFVKLRCSCKCDKAELEKAVMENTKGKMITLDSEKKGYEFPKCMEGHAICFEDLELIFGEDAVEEAKKKVKEGDESISKQ